VEEQFKEYGLTSGLIRLDDKMRRLKNLKDQTHHAVKEPLKDTVTDLSGYAVLLTILLSSEEGYLVETKEEYLKRMEAKEIPEHMQKYLGKKAGVTWKPSKSPFEQQYDINFQPVPPYFDPDDQY
jgi:hypothetical protein